MKTQKTSFYTLLRFLLLASFLFISSCGQNTQNSAENQVSNKEIRIGYQKFGALIYIKEQQLMEHAFEKQGTTVKWLEFTSGPPLLEALNVGGLDIGMTGESPPIFAQAGNSDLVYIAYEAAAPNAEAILIPQNSSIKSVADLKNKKIAVTKGSSAHYTLLAALQAANIPFSEIKVYYLQPSEARTAFERGNVDAWVIWEPFRAAAEVQLNAKTLIDATGLKLNNQFYLASRTYATNHPELIKTFITTVEKANQEINNNRELLVKPIAKLTKLPEKIAAIAVERSRYGVNYIDQKTIDEQQKIADIFYQQKLIPIKIDVSKVIWKP